MTGTEAAELAVLRKALLEIAEICAEHSSPSGMKIDDFIYRVIETMDKPEVKAHITKLKGEG